jgi:beta-1,2-mannobiose phosphorylase / 1,2-beta-oligomannan phosphorylase
MKSFSRTVPILGIVLAGCTDKGVVDPPAEPPPEPPEPTLQWSHHPTAVFLPAGSGWDSQWVSATSVIRWKGRYHMWYEGSAFGDLTHPVAIGYATSEDGYHWVRGHDDPVLAPRGGWDHHYVARPVVLADGDDVHMWYAGGAGWAHHEIGYARSVDGISWERHPEPVITRGPFNEWNSAFVSPGTVINEDGLFKMWFFSGEKQRESGSLTFIDYRLAIGYATSADGIHWTIHNDTATSEPPYRLSDPVFSPSAPGGWDSEITIFPSVVSTDSGYEMWYGGASTGNYGPLGARVGHAISSDGIEWTRSESNPVLTVSQYENASRQFWGILFPNVVAMDDGYKMWYTAWVSGPSHAVIGLATGEVR